jgi:acyl-CoA reductase-like NAD-dependent aldehyde dehydrogenase
MNPVWPWDLDTATAVGRKLRANAVGAKRLTGGFPERPFSGSKRPGPERELGRNVAADYTEEKTFHVRSSPCVSWRLGRKLSA